MNHRWLNNGYVPEKEAQKVSLSQCPTSWRLILGGGSAWNARGQAAASRHCAAISGQLHRRFLVPTGCSWLPCHNVSLRTRWKYPDRRHNFLCKSGKLCQWIWAKRSLFFFWGNDPEFILMAKNVFQRYIICLYLKLFAKSHVFRDWLSKCQFDFVSFCMQGQPGLGIRIWDHSQTRFDAMNPMVISNLANELLLKVWICVKFQ